MEKKGKEKREKEGVVVLYAVFFSRFLSITPLHPFNSEKVIECEKMVLILVSSSCAFVR
jgi:hypothetical protein